MFLDEDGEKGQEFINKYFPLVTLSRLRDTGKHGGVINNIPSVIYKHFRNLFTLLLTCSLNCLFIRLEGT